MFIEDYQVRYILWSIATIDYQTTNFEDVLNPTFYNPELGNSLEWDLVFGGEKWGSVEITYEDNLWWTVEINIEPKVLPLHIIEALENIHNYDGMEVIEII